MARLQQHQESQDPSTPLRSTSACLGGMLLPWAPLAAPLCHRHQHSPSSCPQPHLCTTTASSTPSTDPLQPSTQHQHIPSSTAPSAPCHPSVPSDHRTALLAPCSPLSPLLQAASPAVPERVRQDMMPRYSSWRRSPQCYQPGELIKVMSGDKETGCQSGSSTGGSESEKLPLKSNSTEM